MRRFGRRLKLRPLATILLLAALPLAGCADTDTTPVGGTLTSTPAMTTPTASARVEGTSVEEDFESVATGRIPAGWVVAAGNWSVVTNDAAPASPKVLLSDQTQLGETTILNDAAGSWSDLEARVMFNILAGEKGQAGGIIFRYEDSKNYYVVRYNHNELSWNLFRTIEGNREKFPGTDESADQFQGALGQWTELRLEARGPHIQVFSGNLKVIDYTEEDANAPASGKVGLWTRYDSKTQFDDWSVRAN